MENSRAIRRAHAERLKKYRRNWWGSSLASKHLGKVVDTPTPCSCWMCGNPRRYSGERTIQERRQTQNQVEELPGADETYTKEINCEE